MPILSRYSITVTFGSSFDLANYPVGSIGGSVPMKEGVTAFVISLNANFRYAPTSTAAVDNELVINAAGSVGRWLRITDSRVRPQEASATNIMLSPAPGAYPILSLTNSSNFSTMSGHSIDFINNTESIFIQSQDLDLISYKSDAAGRMSLVGNNAVTIVGYNAGVQIGAYAVQPGKENAALSISSLDNDKGFLPPSLTTAKRLAMVSPNDGMMVHDSDLHEPFTYNLDKWQSPFGAQRALEDMNEPTGFPNSDDAIVTIDEVTRTVTLTPLATSYFFYSRATKFTKTDPESIIFTDVEGAHAIYYDTAGVLQELVKPSITALENLIRLETYVANITWDATNKKAVYWTGPNELHGLQMDGATHSNKHFTQGTQWLVGAALNSLSVDDVTPTDASAQFGIGFGNGLDEDRAFTGSPVASTAGTPIYYLEGASGVLRRSYNAGFSILTGGGGLPVFNEFTGGAFQNTEVTSGNYVWVFSFLTNNSPEGYITFLGSAQYSQIQVARDAVTDDLTVVSTRLGGIVENKVISGVLFEGKSSFTNAVKARIVSTNNGDYEDFRRQAITSAVAAAQHDSLGGLLDSYSHGQYVRANISTSNTSVAGGIPQYEDTIGVVGTSKLRIETIIGTGANVIRPIVPTEDLVLTAAGQLFAIGSYTDQSFSPSDIGFYAPTLVMSNPFSESVLDPMSVTINGALKLASSLGTNEPVSLEFNNAILRTGSAMLGLPTELFTHINIGHGSTTGTASEDNIHPTILNGQLNSATKDFSTVVNGGSNEATGYYSTVVNGSLNKVSGDKSIIGNGGSCQITGDYSGILAGANNLISGDYSSGHGENLIVGSDFSYVGGRYLNLSSGAIGSWAWDVNLGGQDQLTIPYRMSVFPFRDEGQFAIGIGNESTVYKAHIRSSAANVMTLQSSLHTKGVLCYADANAFVIGGYYLGVGGNDLRVSGSGCVINLSGGKASFSGTAIAPTSILDVYSTTSGFKPPRMTTAQRLAYTFPGAETAFVYDSDIKAHFVGNNNAWLQLGAGGGGTGTELINGYATLSANQSIASGSPGSIVQFDQTEAWTDGVTLSGNALVIVTAGYYNLYGAVKMIASTSGNGRRINFLIDRGSGFVEEEIESERTQQGLDGFQYVKITAQAKLLEVGDEIKLNFWQDSGPSQDAFADTYNTCLSAAYAGVTAATPSVGTLKAGLIKYSDQTVSTATNEPVVAWDEIEFNFGISTNLTNGTLTVETGGDGLYHCCGNIHFGAGGLAFDRMVFFMLNSGTVYHGTTSTLTDLPVSVSASIYLQLVAGDVVRFGVRQTSGGDLDIAGARPHDRARFQMVRVGD